MKVLHVSTSDTNGGATRGIYRLHKRLQNILGFYQLKFYKLCLKEF